MNKTAIALLIALLGGCTATTEPIIAPAETPTINACTVTGYERVQLTPDFIEDYAVCIDSFGHTHKLNISDAIIGDEYIVKYGTVLEQTYEGWSEEDDTYIIQFEDGEKTEITADDLRAGDDVTVYFFDGRAIRTLYGRR